MRVSRKNKKIIIGWIPAHKGIYDNEMVDELAREATLESPYEEFKVPVKDLRGTLRGEAFRDTIKELKVQANYKGKFYFDNFFDENVRFPWFCGLNFPRGYVVLINRLRANHYNLKESLERKGYVESARCECGAESEDIDHMVFSCSIFDDQRRKLYEDLDRVGASQPNGVLNWLRREEFITLKTVYEFIRSTGRII